MLSKFKYIVKNHWKKVVVGGVVMQILVIGTRYAIKRYHEYHEAKSMELWQQIQKNGYFKEVELVLKNSFISLALSLRDTVIECLDSDSITLQLKAGNLTTKEKLELWDKLKVIGFARILVIIYGTSLLSVLLRIQLSIIGGYLYLESIDSGKKHEWRNVNGIILSNNTAIDSDLQEKFLALASHLVKNGTRMMCTYIHSRTMMVVDSIDLKQKLTISQLQHLFSNVTEGISEDVLHTTAGGISVPFCESPVSPVKYPWRYIFPADILKPYNNFQTSSQTYRPHYVPPDLYERLLYDAFDLLDSDDVTGLLESFERQGISYFCDRVADCFNVATAQEVLTNEIINASSDGGGDSSIANTADSNQYNISSEMEMPLTKIIPLLNNLASQGISQENDPWISLLINSETSRNLGANVYESFSHFID